MVTEAGEVAGTPTPEGTSGKPWEPLRDRLGGVWRWETWEEAEPPALVGRRETGRWTSEDADATRNAYPGWSIRTTGDVLYLMPPWPPVPLSDLAALVGTGLGPEDEEDDWDPIEEAGDVLADPERVRALRESWDAAEREGWHTADEVWKSLHMASVARRAGLPEPPEPEPHPWPDEQTSPTSAQDEYAFYAEPDNQEPQGPPVRRTPVHRTDPPSAADAPDEPAADEPDPGEALLRRLGYDVEDLVQAFENSQPRPEDWVSTASEHALRAAVQRRDQVEQDITSLVAELRRLRYGWTRIGTLLGLSGPAARDRYGAEQ